MIIAIEGIDASGKQTQVKLLGERLKNAKVFAFPDYESKTGKAILGNLKGEWSAKEDGTNNNDFLSASEKETNALALQAFMTMNRYENYRRLWSYAYGENKDDVLILDRYWASGFAYGVADGNDPEWLLQIHEALPKPVAFILIDMNVSASMARRVERRDRYENDVEHLNRARSAYLDLFSKGAARGGPWHIVDGSQSIERVHEDIMDIVSKLV